MNVESVRIFRRCAACLNYMSLDRPDLCVAANYAARSMAAPKDGEERYVKKVGRHLRKNPVAQLFFPWQALPEHVLVRTDSDWAGCRVTRRSTSGIAIFSART